MTQLDDYRPRTATVLIVDDTPANLAVVVDALGERGFRVLIALDSAEAIERARFSQPELILLDVNMPGINGFDTCRRLKGDAQTRDIPVIFMTVADGISDMIEGFRAGGVDYVTKPVRIDEVIARMDVHLAMREMQTALVEQNRQLQQEVRVRQQAEFELSCVRDELELRVARRTEQLARANDDLRAEIAEREHAQARLKLSEARLREIVEASPVPLCIGSIAKPHVLYANEQWRQLFGVAEHEQPNVSINDFYVEEDGRRKLLERVRLDGNVSDTEVSVRRLDGTTFWVAITARLATFQDEPAIYVGIRDVTERKRIEQALLESREQFRQLSAYMEAIREDDRKRIALEIHDELGQLLTALKMDVSLLKMRLGDAPDLLEKVTGMRDLVEQTILMVRNVANHLRPAALNFGLVSALEWLADDFGKRTGIPCRLVLNAGEPELDDAHATALFRVVQESMTNVARHARATRVHVTMMRNERGLILNVSDNGCGFDPAAAGKRDSYGLLGMSERARLIGASLQIDSAPGSGTVVSISIPVESGREDDQDSDRG
ncbi:hybrid sensor histidine kinase/response regulator [Trinickia acidisoli]|uniref:hybrid sensor histidine kinase/response regulator n=1 Tax=Trinickia acidisoli TaxID=2767482 RepID=UPI001A8F7038|nr:response regulator [Trinickia acidisoli]